MSDEELVPVNLGDDYERGAFFTTDWGPKDHLVPRSQLERWEAATAAYEDMQAEIDAVMDEQRERVNALYAARPKNPMSEFLQALYTPRIIDALQAPATFRRAADKEPE